jgi:hypothetical protein
MMLERLIWKAITDGIATVTADPQLIVDFFHEEALLDLSEAEKIRDYFLENPPHVIHGYARKDGEFPLYAITLTSQGQAQGFIGDEGLFHADPEDPDFGNDDWAAIFEYNFNVLVYTTHPDITLYYFQLLLTFMVTAEPLFKMKGDAFDITYGGADMVPDASTMPAGLFVRRFQIGMKRQYTQNVVGSKLGRAWRVQGIHIDADGAAGEDTGGVPTHVSIMGADNGDEE